MIEQIHFYYCNDLHSHFEQWPNITHYFKKERDKYKERGEQSFRIDIGDHVDRFHPIAEAFKGKANVDLLNEAGFDFATLGNNEGITLEYQDLFQLYDQADFQVTCANLSPIHGDKPNWLKEYITIETSQRLRVTLFGMTATFNAFYHPLGWNASSPYDYLSANIQTLKQNCDVLILLSHLGLSEDEVIAERYPEVDVIIGGHTHHLLKSGKVVNKSLLTAAGKYGKYVGEVHLTWDHSLNKLTDKQAYTVETEYLDRDADTAYYLEQISKEAESVLNQPVAMISNPLEVDWFKQTPLTQDLTDYLRRWTKADIAMLNAGILIEGLKAGTVTYGDVHRICPHPINPCTVELRGAQLLEVIRGTFQHSLQHLELKGFGFRGKIIGTFLFSGISIDTVIDQDGEERVQQVQIDGKPLDPDRMYILATPDMFTFGNMFPEIVRSKTKHFFLPEFMRDLLANLLKENQ
ncbi:bifunctional metallophosphatase/5'-nucleotidase [Gracilibacillus alcaliphilus]|uniref:bifunctional metallophosphatase/5'-nucleotidase n=1 Tax=Gracilibacillus alcaliphilus TaxID=1401441 RepID=UPI00195E0CE5|nr:bifunctional UDP-sugar hydrolase/5'-nucleotidase [Gracilibacillus alcaliphilus]MBM7675900.1 2',3'-cyclic-nucleotide 2'-phosphodiesterase (5'-nucleotidase family) [Gracilibacillus alcaliphilus]